MGFQCGLVGLPNVGKSTLFNALTRAESARAENFPFCTIEPNIGSVTVPDARLDKLSDLVSSEQTINARMQFVDIAGLIKGANEGEGLGNKFLAHIREMDAIAFVLRCFDDDDIIHVENKVDPVADAETLSTELMLADLETVQKRLFNASKKAKSGDKEAKLLESKLNSCLLVLEQGVPIREAVAQGKIESEQANGLQLLSALPVVYVANVGEGEVASGNDYSAEVEKYAETKNAKTIILSASLEAELASIDIVEANAWLAEQGVRASGVDKFVRAGYEALNLITFFTAGPKEARAWTITKRTTAVNAASVIHTDFGKKFIRAEVTSYADFVECGNSLAAREAGKTRLEGKEYIMHDGDVVYFRVGR